MLPGKTILYFMSQFLHMCHKAQIFFNDFAEQNLRGISQG